MKKFNQLASFGLAAALSANACGGRAQSSDTDLNSTIPDNDGGKNGSGGNEAGLGGQGGSVAQPGTLTVRNDLTIPELVGTQNEALTASLRVDTDNIEDQLIKSIRLKVRATGCEGTGISGQVKLFAEGNDTPVATGQFEEQGGYLGYLNFSFPTPYHITRGNSEFFQITADHEANCCHYGLDTFLEKASDLSAIGSTYSSATEIINQYSETDTHSVLNVWAGSVFIDYEGPAAMNIPIGTNEVPCLDAVIFNCNPQNLILSDWQTKLEIMNGDGLADEKDLLNSDTAAANFKQIKLQHREHSGVPLNTLLGPNELYPYGSDISQQIVLSGTAEVAPAERVFVSVSINVEDNQALIGNKIQCVLQTLSTMPEFGSETHTLVAKDFPCVTVERNNVPDGSVLAKGSTDENLGCWNFANSCQQTNLMSLTMEHIGTGNYTDINSLRLFIYDIALSDFTEINQNNGQVTFDNLTLDNNNGINIGPTEVKTLCSHGNISSNADTGAQHGLEIPGSASLVLNPSVQAGGEFPVQGPIFTVTQ